MFIIIFRNRHANKQTCTQVLHGADAIKISKTEKMKNDNILHLLTLMLKMEFVVYGQTMADPDWLRKN